jgi:hypothetical protein
MKFLEYFVTKKINGNIPFWLLFAGWVLQDWAKDFGYNPRINAIWNLGCDALILFALFLYGVITAQRNALMNQSGISLKDLQ